MNDESSPFSPPGPVKSPRLRTPTPGEALALFALVLATNVALGLLLTRFEGNELWLLAATPLTILCWVAVAARFLGVDPRTTFLLRLPSLADFLMAIPLAISFVILSDQLSSLTDQLIPEDYEREVLRLLRVSGAMDWILKIGTIGVGAAVSEELLFRGFIQTAFLRMGKTAGVVATAFLFMLIHGMFFPSIAAAGLVLGFAGLATGSIVVPILIHFINNTAALALLNLADLQTLGDPVWLPPEILVPAIAIFILTMGFYARRLLPELGSPGRGNDALAPRDDPRDRGDGPERTGGGWSSSPRSSPPHAPSLVEELSTVPPAARRRGWLIVAGAVLLGTTVLLGLFFYSLYKADPRSIQGAFIEALSKESRASLAPDAIDREGELASAFEALVVVNEDGNLPLPRLLPIIRTFAEVNADRRIDSAEVDVMIAALREAVGASIAPRRL